MSANPAIGNHDPELPSGATPDEPVRGGDRLVTLDFIRGTAVLGILFANVVAFGYPELAYSWPGALAEPMNQADKAVWLAQYLLIDGKMRGLFTLLFGAGMVLFMERAWARGETRRLQARRLAWLMLFGLIHFVFLFSGDILFLYAIAGLAGLPMVRWEARTLLRVGIFWYLLGALYFAGALGVPAQYEGNPALQVQSSETYHELLGEWDERVRDAKAETEAFTKGNYAAEVGYVVEKQSQLLLHYPFFALFETIPLMLIGMGLYRYGLFSGGIDRGAMRRWGWAGVIVGTALTLPLGLWAMSEGFPPFLTGFIFNGGAQAQRLPVILGLAALLSLLAPRAATGWLGSRLVAAGRMAFSNYIGTSLMMMLVFRHWAGGMFGELSRVELVGVVLGGWVLMLAWSKPWLARYRYGPLEWCWRCLTYGRLFPMRR